MAEGITATIEEWEVYGGMVYGKIYGDTKGRFPDGTHIRTSLAKEGQFFAKGEIIETANSRYRLGKQGWE